MLFKTDALKNFAIFVNIAEFLRAGFFYRKAVSELI